jgi:hypothetical protein
MKIKVIKDCYYVHEDLTNIGLVDKDGFENSFSHLLVKGDIWESIDDESNFNEQLFICIEGKWLDDENDGWWVYEGNECYFEIIEE